MRKEMLLTKKQRHLLMKMVLHFLNAQLKRLPYLIIIILKKSERSIRLIDNYYC